MRFIWNLRFGIYLEFEIWDLFGIWNLEFGNRFSQSYRNDLQNRFTVEESANCFHNLFDRRTVASLLTLATAFIIAGKGFIFFW